MFQSKCGISGFVGATSVFDEQAVCRLTVAPDFMIGRIGCRNSCHEKRLRTAYSLALVKSAFVDQVVCNVGCQHASYQCLSHPVGVSFKRA